MIAPLSTSCARDDAEIDLGLPELMIQDGMVYGQQISCAWDMTDDLKSPSLPSSSPLRIT